MDQHEAFAYQDFLGRFPQYTATLGLDEIRQQEYPLLEEQQQTYLDYTGACLYSWKQVQEHSKLLQTHIFGNPHSINPASAAMTKYVIEARERVAKFFGADEEEYDVIFTPNCSGALKLLGESYPFEDGGELLLTSDNHNSVVGLREFAHHAQAPVHYLKHQTPDMNVDPAEIKAALERSEQGRPRKNRLFAFPGQSNFTGVKYPLEWIAQAQERGWDVLLDAAAYVPTNQLNLRQIQPDAISLSFYKMFGYPSGVGALIIKNKLMAKLRRPWFSGGTIVAVSLKEERHQLYPWAKAFEDGTINYLTLPAVTLGLNHLEHLGMNTIHTRVMTLTSYLLEELQKLPTVQIYGPTQSEDTRRGGTIALNFRDRISGKILDYTPIQENANRHGISLRTGCFCNPGTGETVFNIESGEITRCFQHAHSFETSENYLRCLTQDEKLGAIRVSLGLVSNFHDVYKFLSFCRSYS